MQYHKQSYFLLFILFGNILAIQSQAENESLAHIKSIIVKPNLTNTYAPFIKIDETLTVMFDDLNANMEDYSYKITHCDFNWKPTNLIETEYITGFASDRIRDYEASFNTLQPYVNYRFQIPNKNTRIRITGNYLISVLNENEDVVFTRKFIVYQNKTSVGVTIHKSRTLNDYKSKQTVQFVVHHPNVLINNPSQEIKAVILQNNDWKTAITNLKPQFIRGSQLLYKYDKKASFLAGNEFLFFDTKSIRISGPNIHSVIQGKDLYETLLYTDEQEHGNAYTSSQDINGNFVIRILHGEDSNIEADYSWVHFSLATLNKNEQKDIYINGSFNDWQLNKTNKMAYNRETGMFEAKILLKQGFYNYNYIEISKNKISKPAYINGSFYQTENDYTVLIYYHKIGSRYQEIIGIGKSNSINTRN